MTKSMNCQTAQEQMQDLLDRRWSQPLPEPLQDHLSECQPCQSWQTLFSVDASSCETAPADFARRVLTRYTQEQKRQRWFRNSSLLALAASLLIACFAWYLNRPITTNPVQPQRQPEFALGNPRELLDNMRQDYFLFQSRLVAQLPTPTIPDTIITAMALPELDDPLSIGLPAIRTISTTFQGAVEPYEAPARAAYDKVKSLIDKPEVKKLMDTLKQRWT